MAVPGGTVTKKCSPVSNSAHTRCSSRGGRGKTVLLSCTGISHRGTLPKVMVTENGRNHERVFGDASVQDAFRGEINEGSRVDPPLVFGGAAPPSELPCEATQNCVQTQLRFGHSGSCALPKGFRTMSVKFRPRRATLTRRGCPPQRCAAEQLRQQNASPGLVPFLCSPTSLSHRRRNSKDARDVSLLVENATIQPRRYARYLASKGFDIVHLFSVYCAHVLVSSLHHPTTRKMNILWCTTSRYQRRNRAVPPVRASSCPQSTLVCEAAVFGTVIVKTIRSI